MLRLYKFALALLLALGLSASGSAQEQQVTRTLKNEPNLTVGTFNIRCKTPKDDAKGDGWDTRKKWVADLIEFEYPDIFGTQEVRYEQKLDLIEMLPEYDCVGVGRDDGENGGEHELIFFKRNRFKVLRHGDFWLSETPEVPSKGWDAALPRICTWAYLKDRKTHKKIWFFNLHNDHIGVLARQEAAKLVVARIKEMTKKGEQVFLTGDFNVDQNNEIYKTYTALLEDSFMTAEKRYTPNGTANSFRPDTFTKSRIDHIFVSPGTDVVRFGLLTETYRTENEASADAEKSGSFPKEIDFHTYTARTPSDHFPVFIKLKL